MAITHFGQTSQSADVARITLAAHDMQVGVLTYGAALQSVQLAGVAYDLTLGSDDLALYEGPLRFHGTIVGPVANRLTGARAVIDGTEYRFAANEASGHLLHGGLNGTHARVWQIAQADDTAVSLTLDLHDDGFPGLRALRLTYAIIAPGTLQMEIVATTNAPTLLNLAQHGYWNLDGTPTWVGHSLQVAADHYLPTDADLSPTGEVQPVAGTPFDLRMARVIGIGDPFIDNNFCLSRGSTHLRDVAWLTGQSGLRLTLATTEPGLQVFNGPQALRPGTGPHGAIALEAQGWPDAPNQPTFPSIAVVPGQTYHQVTHWRFDRV